jgi:hypothetical protein
VATFNNLSINNAGTGYTLTAASGGLTGTTSNPFNITAGAASQLAFSGQPTVAVVGQTLSPAVTVRILDAFGNLTASTANVTLALGANPGGGTLGGTATVAAVGGVATFNNLSIDNAGTGYTLTAASGGLTGATSNAFNITAASTTTAITSDSPDPSVVGQAVTVAYSVAISGVGAGTPTGNVTVSDGVNSCAGTVAAGSCAVTLTTVGNRTLTASYAGDANFAGSTSTGAAHTVNQASTTTAITSDLPDPSVIGQSYTVSASVAASAPGSGTPTGNVTVSDGTNTCTITLPATGCTLPSTAPGTKTLTASYAGDANFAGSASAGTTHTVSQASTTTAITADTPDPSVVGQSYTVSASVAASAPGSGTPTGNVTVSDGTNTCTITLPATGCTLPSTAPGTKTLTASYAGDANFAGSTSTGTTHTVSQAGTTTAITADTPDPSVVGQAVTATYTVTVSGGGAGTPTGNVTVSDGVDTCTGTVAAGSCAITLTTGGSRTLTASYAGDANFAGSTSTGTTHTVSQAGTTTAITADTPDPSVVGQSYTVSASVAASAPGSGTPTGNVTVSDGTNTCTITLPATGCTLPSTAPGTKTLTASYAGDANFAGSTSTGAAHTVNLPTTFTGPTATGTGDATASVSGLPAGCGFTLAEFIPLEGHPHSPPAGSVPNGIAFPQGLFNFQIGGACGNGFTTTVTLTYPQSLPAGTQYYKYGPTPTHPAPSWYVLPTTVNGNSVSFTLTDGAPRRRRPRRQRYPDRSRWTGSAGDGHPDLERMDRALGRVRPAGPGRRPAIPPREAPAELGGVVLRPMSER